jgi:hypothetical protein
LPTISCAWARFIAQEHRHNLLRGFNLCRPGRRRKSGAREPSGRLKRIAAAERRAQIGERGVVLGQPHRRDGNGGNLDQRCESPIGRLCLKHGLRSEFYDTALRYGALGRFFLFLKASRVDIHDAPARGSGADAGRCHRGRTMTDFSSLFADVRRPSPLSARFNELKAENAELRR